MNKVCVVSGREFDVTDADLEFYEKMGVPASSLCPDERARRRWAWRGKDFYMRGCDKCGKNVMSWFPPELELVTYCDDCFKADDFDALQF